MQEVKRLKSVYLETTIPSLATSRPSRDTIVAGRQAATLNFWESERHKFDLYVSQYVIDECAFGDPDAARRRLDLLSGVPVLPLADEIITLATEYQKLLGIPDKAKLDCFHLATCVVAEMDYLLSWNCVHLGVRTFAIIREFNGKRNLWSPLLITPDALTELENYYD
jgi:hypothetical protein